MFTPTPQERKLLNFVRERIAADGVCPSYAEIAAALGLSSKSGINRLIRGLESRGLVRRLPRKYRAIEIVDHSHNLSAVLKPNTLAALLRYSARTGERVADIINDAIDAHLDEMERIGDPPASAWEART